MNKNSSPTAEDVRKHLATLSNMKRYSFFEAIKNPKAFDLLMSAGAFEAPNKSEVVGNQERYFSWPPTAFLKNVVKAIPERVSELLVKLPLDKLVTSTEFAAVVAEMPADIISKIIPSILSWLDEPHTDWIWYSYVTIIAHLTEANAFEPALILSRRVLRVRAEPEITPWSQKKSFRAVSDVGESSYDFIVSGILRAFRSQSDFSIVNVLAETLASAFEIRAIPRGKDDYSTIWTKALDQKPLGGSAATVLPYWILEMLSEEIKLTGIPIGTALERLSSLRKWQIFRRMQLWLVREFGEAQDRRDALLDDEAIKNGAARTEYDLLLTHCFAELNSSDRNKILSKIKRGLPRREQLRKWILRSGSTGDVESAVEKFRRRELVQRLAPIGPYLTGQWAAEFSRLSAEFPRDDYSHDSGAVWIGPEAPSDLETMAAMSTTELFDYVESWVSPKRSMAPSYAGLGLQLSQIVEQRIPEILSNVSRILTWPPVYVYHVINGLRKHLYNDSLDRIALFRLLSYVYTYGMNFAEGRYAKWEEDEEDWTTDWIDAVAIAAGQVVGDILRLKTVTLEEAAQLWTLLRFLFEFPQKRVYTQSDLRTTRPWNMALNTVRGSAMLASIEYLRFRYRVGKQAGIEHDLLDVTPDVFVLFDTVLGSSEETEVVTRAALGQNFVSLFAMSRHWTVPRINQIFGGPEYLKEAAWQTYVAMNALYEETYCSMVDLYDDAVNQLGARSDTNGDLESPERLIAPHIMQIYLLSLSDIRQEDSLIRRYLQRASDEGMDAGLFWVSTTNFPTSTWSKVEELFDFLIDRAEEKPSQDESALARFALLLRRPDLPKAWAIQTLRRVLKIAHGKIAAGDHLILDWLAELCDDEPLEAISILRELVSTRDVMFLSSSEAVRKIIASGVALRGDGFRFAADVVYALCEMGFDRYVDLLESVLPGE